MSNTLREHEITLGLAVLGALAVLRGLGRSTRSKQTPRRWT